MTTWISAGRAAQASPQALRHRPARLHQRHRRHRLRHPLPAVPAAARRSDLRSPCLGLHKRHRRDRLRPGRHHRLAGLRHRSEETRLARRRRPHSSRSQHAEIGSVIRRLGAARRLVEVRRALFPPLRRGWCVQRLPPPLPPTPGLQAAQSSSKCRLPSSRTALIASDCGVQAAPPPASVRPSRAQPARRSQLRPSRRHPRLMFAAAPPRLPARRRRCATPPSATPPEAVLCRRRRMRVQRALCASLPRA